MAAVVILVFIISASCITIAGVGWKVRRFKPSKDFSFANKNIFRSSSSSKVPVSTLPVSSDQHYPTATGSAPVSQLSTVTDRLPVAAPAAVEESPELSAVVVATDVCSSSGPAVVVACPPEASGDFKDEEARVERL